MRAKTQPQPEILNPSYNRATPETLARARLQMKWESGILDIRVFCH